METSRGQIVVTTPRSSRVATAAISILLPIYTAKHQPSGSVEPSLTHAVRPVSASWRFSIMADRASPFSFERCSLHHQQHLLTSWHRSSGLISLVGDWHSHPTGRREPSWTDGRAWAELIRSMHRDGIALIAPAHGARIFFLNAGFKLRKISEFHLEETGLDCVFRRFTRPHSRL